MPRFMNFKFSAINALPEIPRISGYAFVFGSAPGANVPIEAIKNCEIVTANASQVSLENYGVEEPDYTFMRCNMHLGRQIDAETLEALRGRSTRHLILMGEKKNQVHRILKNKFSL